MEMTPFHAYCYARTLQNLSDEEKLLPVYASSDIQVYPYQIAAAGFALRSPGQKGAILCDEASHEATLIMAQRHLEGYNPCSAFRTQTFSASGRICWSGAILSPTR